MSAADESHLLQSSNWGEMKDKEGFVDEGFPFREGFPMVGPYEDKEFVLIFRSGERLRGRVDFSTQYRAEGLQWRIEQPSEFTSLPQFVIAAWCELPEKEVK